jgi:sugar lactone lactonase YvrE
MSKLRLAVATCLLSALVIGAPASSALTGRTASQGGSGGDRALTLVPDPAGNPEGIAFDKRGDRFFVSITGDGAIYSGSPDGSTVTPFIPGAPGRSAVGLEVHKGMLYVAGGATGTVTVYDLESKQQVALFETGAGGFLNDLTVTRRGDVYVTDSFRPVLWHITGEQVRAGSGTVQALDVSGSIDFQPGAFNLNGIVALGGHRLVVGQSATGQLFRIDLDRSGTAITAIDEIEGVSVPGADGIIRDRGRLVIVQGSPAQLHFVKLKGGARRAEDEGTRTSPLLHGPSTVDRAGKQYLVVNADFALAASPPFTVASLAR